MSVRCKENDKQRILPLDYMVMYWNPLLLISVWKHESVTNESGVLKGIVFLLFLTVLSSYQIEGKGLHKQLHTQTVDMLFYGTYCGGSMDHCILDMERNKLAWAFDEKHGVWMLSW